MLVEDQTTNKNRILKLLETVGVKLAMVATDVFGKSGLEMLRSIAQGTESLEAIVQKARGVLRKKIPDLRRALGCSLADHHRQMLRDQLARFDRTTEEIATYDARLLEKVAPYQESIQQIASITGIQQVAAIAISRRLVAIYRAFPPKRTSLRGPACAPATTKVPARAVRVVIDVATHTCNAF